MNPELKRNLWLECSLHRLIAMPVVLGLCFLGIALGAEEDPRPRLASIGLLMFFGLTVLWGTRCATASVAEEYRTKTWDGQRLSAIDPWTMTWGKLVGSTAFVWYGALMCLGVVVVVWPPVWQQPVETIVGLALCSVLGIQALALLASLLATQKDVTRSAPRTIWVGICIFGLLAFGRGVALMPLLTDGVTWWGRETEVWAFLLWSTGVFSAWAIFGAYRLMCQALQVRRLPWAWVAFVLFLTWYLTGFVPSASLAEARAVFGLVGLLLTLVSTYLLLFAEQSGAMVMRRIWIRLQRREWRRALEDMPCWPLSLLLALLFCGLLVPTSDHLPGGLAHWHDLGFPLLPLLALLFCVRDIAIFQFFAYARIPRRVEATAMFYLILLYGVLPAVSRASGAPLLSTLLLPLPWAVPAYAALAVLTVHVGIAVGLVVHRWRTIVQDVQS